MFTYTNNSWINRYNLHFVVLHFFNNNTDHRQDDNGHVEYVPLVFDIHSESERNQLHDTLQNEDGRKEVVEDAQQVFPNRRHHVAFSCHSDHVETNHGGDG